MISSVLICSNLPFCVIFNASQLILISYPFIFIFCPVYYRQTLFISVLTSSDDDGFMYFSFKASFRRKDLKCPLPEGIMSIVTTLFVCTWLQLLFVCLFALGCLILYLQIRVLVPFDFELVRIYHIKGPACRVLLKKF